MLKSEKHQQIRQIMCGHLSAMLCIVLRSSSLCLSNFAAALVVPNLAALLCKMQTLCCFSYAFDIQYL